mgnify:CR=1 FL=1
MKSSIRIVALLAAVALPVSLSFAQAPGAAPMYVTPVYGGSPYGGYGVAPRKVGFGEAIKRAFGGWSDYSGRATLGEFWWFYLFYMIVTFVIFMPGYLLMLGGIAATSDGSAPGALFWIGTLVYDGEVYDHIHYRLRGANGRYHPGKRSIRFKAVLRKLVELED